MHVIGTDISVWINEIADETSKALHLEMERGDAREEMSDCSRKIEQVLPQCRDYEINKTDVQVTFHWNQNPKPEAGK